MCWVRGECGESYMLTKYGDGSGSSSDSKASTGTVCFEAVQPMVCVLGKPVRTHYEKRRRRRRCCCCCLLSLPSCCCCCCSPGDWACV